MARLLVEHADVPQVDLVALVHVFGALYLAALAASVGRRGDLQVHNRAALFSEHFVVVVRGGLLWWIWLRLGWF